MHYIVFWCFFFVFFDTFMCKFLYSFTIHYIKNILMVAADKMSLR